MKYKILEFLKSNDDFVSGEYLGEKFGVSRNAICKNIAKLKELGYSIESSTKKGYRLTGFSDVLNDYEIKSFLSQKTFGKNFLFLKETGSTNDEAKKLARKGAAEGFLVIAKKQTKGKGRFGNLWTHSENSNLAFSIILRPSFMLTDITPLTLVAGLSICRALRKLDIPAFVKWPNDIIINGKKAVGILTELSCEIEKINYAVIGVGINVNGKAFDGELKEKATSFFMETGKKYKRLEILDLVLAELEKDYYKFIQSDGFLAFAGEYESLCLNIGKNVIAVSGEKKISGTAVGISPKGGLIIKDKENRDLCVVSGEFSVRLENGKYI